MVRTAFLKKGRKEHIMGRIQVRPLQPAYNLCFSAYFFSRNSIFLSRNSAETDPKLPRDRHSEPSNRIQSSEMIQSMYFLSHKYIIVTPFILKKYNSSFEFEQVFIRFKNRIKFFL
jgi:hypothetical protein